MKKLPFLILLLISACTSEKIEEPIELDCTQSGLSVTATTTVSNCGASDGGAELVATGGEGPYEYIITGNIANESGLFTGLSAGNFTGTVTDAIGCTAIATFTVSSLGGVNISSAIITDAGCKTSNGSVTITATDGTPPYSYNLDNGTATAENVINNLGLGSYEVSVTDANDCEATQQITITSGVSLATDIMPIINQNCALSGCHAGSQSPNFTSSANIIANAARIKFRTSASSNQMPPSGKLSASLIDQIACWVDDGALDN
ncbi:MAG: hypothetical protein ACJA08_002504 [Cyclobacteriaceae bacterium]|jgi:hypothetical protein